eukprot:2790030-Alexandrium_andersonii.AAC.1
MRAQYTLSFQVRKAVVQVVDRLDFRLPTEPPPPSPATTSRAWRAWISNTLQAAWGPLQAERNAKVLADPFAFFNGGVRSTRLRRYCKGRSCCKNRGEAIRKAKALVFKAKFQKGAPNFQPS